MAKNGDRAAFLRAMAEGAEFWFLAKNVPTAVRRRVVKARSKDVVLSSYHGDGSQLAYMDHPKANEVVQVSPGVFVVRDFAGMPMRYEFVDVPTFSTWSEYWASVPKTYDLAPMIGGKVGVALQFMRDTQHHQGTLQQVRDAVRRLRSEGWRRGKILAFA